MKISVKEIYNQNGIPWNPLYDDSFEIDTEEFNGFYMALSQGSLGCYGIISPENFKEIRQKAYCYAQHDYLVKGEYPVVIISVAKDGYTLIEKIEGCAAPESRVDDLKRFLEKDKRGYEKSLAAFNFYKKLAGE